MSIDFTRTFPLEGIEITRSGDGRTVDAYAAVFDTPAEIKDRYGRYRESIARTAFDKTLRERGPSRVGVFYHHGLTLHGTPSDLGSVPLGSPMEIVADGRGLRTVTRYNKSALADSVLEAIRAGDIRGQSFRGRIFQSTPENVPRRKVGDAVPDVIRTELGLTEYGPTPFPAYEGAGIVAVRSLGLMLEDFSSLTQAERDILIKLLASTTPEGPETDTATPTDGAGAGESPVMRSGRSAIQHARRRADLIAKGVLSRG
jgi:uncharacterized protein